MPAMEMPFLRLPWAILNGQLCEPETPWGHDECEEWPRPDEDAYDPRKQEYILPAAQHIIESAEQKLLERQLFQLEQSLVRRRRSMEPDVLKHYEQLINEMWSSPRGMQLAEERNSCMEQVCNLGVASAPQRLRPRHSSEQSLDGMESTLRIDEDPSPTARSIPRSLPRATPMSRDPGSYFARSVRQPEIAACPRPCGQPPAGGVDVGCGLFRHCARAAPGKAKAHQPIIGAPSVEVTTTGPSQPAVVGHEEPALPKLGGQEDLSANSHVATDKAGAAGEVAPDPRSGLASDFASGEDFVPESGKLAPQDGTDPGAVLVLQQPPGVPGNPESLALDFDSAGNVITPLSSPLEGGSVWPGMKLRAACRGDSMMNLADYGNRGYSKESSPTTYCSAVPRSPSSFRLSISPGGDCWDKVSSVVNESLAELSEDEMGRTWRHSIEERRLESEDCSMADSDLIRAKENSMKHKELPEYEAATARLTRLGNEGSLPPAATGTEPIGFSLTRESAESDDSLLLAGTGAFVRQRSSTRGASMLDLAKYADQHRLVSSDEEEERERPLAPAVGQVPAAGLHLREQRGFAGTSSTPSFAADSCQAAAVTPSTTCSASDSAAATEEHSSLLGEESVRGLLQC